MKFILGTKQHMTQFFDENGKVFAATVVSAGPIVVTQVKTKEKDGYSALQYAFGSRREKNLSKAEKGHFKDLGLFRYVREVSASDSELGEAKRGDTVDAGIFSKGDAIDVAGVSKGKGFQGVIKRHGFHGGPRTHGQKHSEREPGSIGGGLRTRVPKGMKMGGRMGSDRVTVKNLRVLDVDTEQNLLLVKGAIPGKRGTLIEIYESVKSLPKKTTSI